MADFKYIFLYRHGETDLNVEGITMGQLSSLHTKFTQNGLNQIKEIKNKIIVNGVEAIYSSDYERTLETAEMANENLNLPLVISSQLRGLNMGKYQGLPMEVLLNSNEAKASFTDHSLKFLNGESINDLNSRVINYILSICSKTKYNRIALITHSAVISNIVSHLLNVSYRCLNECTLCYSNSKLEVIKYDNNEKELIKR